MTKHRSRKQNLAAAACYLLERTGQPKRLVRQQKKKLHPRALDEYLSSIGDKKINELLIAKHHEPVHLN